MKEEEGVLTIYDKPLTFLLRKVRVGGNENRFNLFGLCEESHALKIYFPCENEIMDLESERPAFETYPLFKHVFTYPTLSLSEQSNDLFPSALRTGFI